MYEYILSFGHFSSQIYPPEDDEIAKTCSTFYWIKDLIEVWDH